MRLIIRIISYEQQTDWYAELIGKTFYAHRNKYKNFVVKYNNRSKVVLACNAEIIQNDKPGASTPKQYGIPENATDLQDLIEYRAMNFAMGNIFKACYRLGHCDHSDSQRELNKIIWFANRELQRIQKEQSNDDK